MEERIKKRIQELTQQLIHHQNQANAHKGAIQALEELLIPELKIEGDK